MCPKRRPPFRLPGQPVFPGILAVLISAWASATEVTLEFVDGTRPDWKEAPALVSERAASETSPLGGAVLTSWPGDQAGLDGRFFFPVEEKHDEAHGTVDRIIQARGKFDLKNGRHRIHPGGLGLLLADLKLAEVESPLCLEPDEDRLRVPCFPVEFKVSDAESGRRIRFSIRLEESQEACGSWDGLLGLTLWLPPTGRGGGYAAELTGPGEKKLRTEFRVGPSGGVSDAGTVSNPGIRVQPGRIEAEFARPSDPPAGPPLARWLNPPENPDEARVLREKLQVFLESPFFQQGQPLTVTTVARIALSGDPVFRWRGLWPRPDLDERPEATLDPLSEKDPVQRRYLVSPPSGPPGPYRLLVLLPARDRATPWELETLAALLPAEGDASLSLFTDRNRADYLEGETVEFTLAARGRVPESSGRFVLESPGRVPLALPGEIHVGPDRPLIQTFRLDTTLLSPGEYDLFLRMGATSSRPLRFRLAGHTRRTHFDILEWHQYGGEGSLLHDTVALRRLSEMGYNAVGGNLSLNSLGLPYDWEDVRWAAALRLWNEDAARLVQAAEALPAPECFYTPNIIERSFQDSVHYGIGLVANMFGNGRGMVLNFAIPEDENERRRIMSLWSLQLHPYPSLLGFAYCCGDAAVPVGWDIGYCGQAAVDMRLGERMRILHETFAREHGPVGDLAQPVVVHADEADVNNVLGVLYTKALAREKTAVDPQAVAREAERRIRWGQHINAVWMNTFADLRRLSGEYDPGLLVSCGSTYNSEARSGVWFPFWYRHQDIRVNSRCTDYGVFVNHLGYTDFMRIGMPDDGSLWSPVRLWEHRLQCNPTAAFRDQVAAISRGATGGGLWESGFADGRNLSRSGSETALQNNALMERYGDLFLALERRDDIALLHSFHECAIVGETYQPVHLAHFILTRLGYMVRIVDEEELAAGRLGGARALFLVQQHVDLPPPARQALEACQARGLAVFADQDTSVEWAGVRRLPVRFVPPRVKVDGGIEYVAYYQAAREAAPKLRQALEAAVAPIARLPERDDLHLSFGRLGYGDSTYLFALNDTSPFGDAVEQFPILPIHTTLEIECGGQAVFDLLSGRRLQPQGGGDRRTIPGDFTAVPARLFALLPEAPQSLEISAPEKVAPGHLLRVSCRALGGGGRPLDVALPVELAFTPIEGPERYHLFRAIRGEWAEALKIGLNDPPGPYRLSVQELLTGLTAETPIEILPSGSPGDPLPPEPRPLGPVLTFDPDGIRQVLRTCGPFTFLLDPSQKGLKADADALAASLQQEGVSIAVRFYDEIEFRNLPMQWDYKLEDLDRKNDVLAGRLMGYRVRGKNHLGDERFDGILYNFYTNYTPEPPFAVNASVVLAGKPGDHLLLDSLYRNNLIARRITPHFPGPGRGMLQLVRNPFYFDRHAVCLLAGDDAGLRQAMEALAHFNQDDFGSADPPLRRPRLLPGRLHLKLQPQVAGLTPEERPAAVRASSDRRPFPCLAERFGAWIESLDVRGERMMAGVKSWGNNLVVTDRQGNVQWARKTSVNAVEGPWYIIDQAGKGLLLDDGRLALDSEFTVLLDTAGKPLMRTPYRAAARFLPDGCCFYGAPMDPLGVFGVMGYNALVAYGPQQQFLWSYDSRALYQSADEHLRKRSVSRLIPLPDHRIAVLFSAGEPFFRDAPQKDVLLVFDQRTGRLLSRIGDASIEQMGVSSNGHYLAVSHRRPPRSLGGGTIELFHHEGRRLLRASAPSSALKLAVDNEGRSVFIQLAGLFPGLYRLDAADAPAAFARCLPLDGRFLNDFEIRPDGERIAAVSLDGVIVWTDRQGQVLWRKETGLVATSFRLLPEEERLILSTTSGRILTLDLDGRERSRIDLTPSVVLTPEERARSLQSLGELSVLAPPQTLDHQLGFLETLPKAVEASPAAVPGLPEKLLVQPGAPRRIPLPHTRPGSTYVLVFRYQNRPGGTLRISLQGTPDLTDPSTSTAGGSEVVTQPNWQQPYAASEDPREALYAFKGFRADLALQIESLAAETALTGLRLVRLKFPTRNFAFIPNAMDTAGQSTSLQEDPATETLMNNVQVEATGFYAMDLREKTLPPTGNFIKLFNGRPYDMEIWYDWSANPKSWYQARYFGNTRGYPTPCTLVLTFPKERKIGLAAIWEDNRKPEFPARESVLEYWDEALKAWQKLAAAEKNTHAYHVHAFTPRSTRQVRYTLVLTGDFRKDDQGSVAPAYRGSEIELYGSEASDLDDLEDEQGPEESAAGGGEEDEALEE